MSRYGNVTVLPAEPNPWADALGLLGGIMGKNAADRQGVKDINGIIDSYVPAENPSLLSNVAVTNPTAQAPNQSATTGGLLGGNVIDNVTAGLTPNTSFLDKYTSNNPATTTQAAQANPQQQTAPKTFADSERSFNQGWAQKTKADLSKMSPDAANKYLPQLLAQRDKDLATLKTEWTKQETANNWDLFNAETDPKKKLFLGTKLSLPPESMKMLLQPDTTTQLVNMGDRQIQVGTNRYTGQMINMETGQPLSAEDLQMAMTPGQAAQIAETSRHNGVMESRPVGGYSYGGGSKSSSNMSKEEKWAQNYEISSSGLSKDQAVIDTLYDAPYLTPAQQTQLTQALTNRDNYWKITSDGEYGTEDTSSTGSGDVKKIMDANPNMTEEQASAYLDYLIKNGG